jgi:hypothetical protein
VHRRGTDADAFQEIQERIGAQLIHCATVAIVLTPAGERVDALECCRSASGRESHPNKRSGAVPVGLARDVAVGDRFGSAGGGIRIGLQHGAAEAVAKLARCEIPSDRQHSRGDRRRNRVVDQSQDVSEDPRATHVDRALAKGREHLRHNPNQVAAELDLGTSGGLRPRQRERDLIGVETGPCVGCHRDHGLE